MARKNLGELIETVIHREEWKATARRMAYIVEGMPVKRQGLSPLVDNRFSRLG